MPFIKQRNQKRSFSVTFVHSRHYWITTRHYQVALITLLLLCLQHKAASFVVPGTINRPKVASTKDSHNSILPNRYCFQYNCEASTAARTVLYLVPDKDRDTDEDQDQDDENMPLINKLGKIGSRIISSVRRSSDGGKNTDDNTDDGDQDDEPKKSWFGKGKTNIDTDKQDSDGDDNDTNTSGVMGFVSSTFKIRKQSKEENNAPVRDDPIDKSDPRKNSPFGDQNNADPFKSEVALAKELEKEEALDSYMSGDANQIPEVFLPTKSKDGALGIDRTLETIDNSLSFVREKMKYIRLNNSDENNMLFLTPQQENKRLNKIRKDLESKRQDIIEQERDRTRERDAKERAKAEKLRTAAVWAKKQKEQQKKKEKRLRARAQREKNIARAARGEDVVIVIDEEDDDDDDEEDSGDNPIEIQKGRVGAFVDGMVGGATSAIGNAWSTFRTTAKGEEDEWIPVCPKMRISPGEVYPVVAGGLELLVIGSKDGTQVFCVSNTCPHLGTPLETGMVERKPCPKITGPASKSTGLSTDDDTKVSVDDGFEECIVCPLHRTAFSLDTGEVRGEWCPYPPVIGKVMGAVKAKSNLTTFTMRTRGKNLEIKISSQIENDGDDDFDKKAK